MFCSNIAGGQTLLDNVDILRRVSRSYVKDLLYTMHALSISINAGSKSLADFCAWRRRCDLLRSVDRRAAVCSAVAALRQRLSQSRFDNKLFTVTRLHLSTRKTVTILFYLVITQLTV